MLKQTEDDEETLFRGEKLIWERKDVNSSYHCNFLRVRKIKIEFDGDSLKGGGKKKTQHKQQPCLPTNMTDQFLVSFL